MAAVLPDQVPGKGLVMMGAYCNLMELVGAITDRELPESGTKSPQEFAISDRSYQYPNSGGYR